MSFDNIQSLPYLVPELLLTVTLIAIFIGDLAIANKQRLGEIALVGTAMALVALSRLSSWPDGWLFNRMIVHDQFAVFFKLIFALATVATVLMSLSSNEVQRCLLHAANRPPRENRAPRSSMPELSRDRNSQSNSSMIVVINGDVDRAALPGAPQRPCLPR